MRREDSMRSITTTTVSVHVNDRTDRTNVVAMLREDLRRMRLFLRGACKQFARQLGEQRLQARHAVCAKSPSWGGYCPSGGPGTAMSS
jgi:hypothetical protein